MRLLGTNSATPEPTAILVVWTTQRHTKRPARRLSCEPLSAGLFHFEWQYCSERWFLESGSHVNFP